MLYFKYTVYIGSWLTCVAVGRSINYSDVHAMMDSSQGKVYNPNLIQEQGQATIMVTVLKARLNVSTLVPARCDIDAL